MLRPLFRASRPVTQYIKLTLTFSPLSPPLALTGVDFAIYRYPYAGEGVNLTDFLCASLFSELIHYLHLKFRHQTDPPDSRVFTNSPFCPLSKNQTHAFPL